MKNKRIIVDECFEEQAHEYLAARGATEKPRELQDDIAEWLQTAYKSGLWYGRNDVRCIAEEAARHMSRVVQEIDKQQEQDKPDGDGTPSIGNRHSPVME